MRLKYVGTDGSKRKRVNWYDSVDKKNPEFTMFSPEGETTEERGKRLLANPEYAGQFVEVPAVEPNPAEFACDMCDFVARSEAGLGSHKRKHKEQQ